MKAADNNLTAPCTCVRRVLRLDAAGDKKGAEAFFPADRRRLSRLDGCPRGRQTHRQPAVEMATRNHNLSQFGTLPSAADMRFGIVVAEWNREITEALLEGAVRTLRAAGCPTSTSDQSTCRARSNWRSGRSSSPKYTDVDAVIALGCVIQGDTRHFDFICQGCDAGASRSCSCSGTCRSSSACSRSTTCSRRSTAAADAWGNKGDEAAATAVNMVKLQIDMDAASAGSRSPDRATSTTRLPLRIERRPPVRPGAVAVPLGARLRLRHETHRRACHAAGPSMFYRSSA